LRGEVRGWNGVPTLTLLVVLLGRLGRQYAGIVCTLDGARGASARRRIVAREVEIVPRRASASTTSIARLRIVLREVEPPIWRLIEAPSRITLIQLADAFLVTMGWLGYHLYEYRIRGQAYGDPDPDFAYEREIKDLRRVHLDSVAPGVGDTFEFLYDFGDGWVHDIAVEAVAPPEPRVGYPRVIAGERACPPEDVGGPSGYADFLAAISDPSNGSHEEMLDWVGGEFDPEWFDIDGINDFFEFGG
jgi:hypothetical protein